VGNKQNLQHGDIDEDDAVRQHQNMYSSGGGNHSASSGNVGAAAAMQALKMFTGGGSGGGMGRQQQQHQGGGGAQNQFIGMAMAQAAQLFDKQSAQGNTASPLFNRQCLACFRKGRWHAR